MYAFRIQNSLDLRQIHLVRVSRNLLLLFHQFGLKLGETNNLNSLPIKVFANKN